MKKVYSAIHYINYEQLELLNSLSSCIHSNLRPRHKLLWMMSSFSTTSFFSISFLFTIYPSFHIFLIHSCFSFIPFLHAVLIHFFCPIIHQSDINSLSVAMSFGPACSWRSSWWFNSFPPLPKFVQWGEYVSYPAQLINQNPLGADEILQNQHHPYPENGEMEASSITKPSETSKHQYPVKYRIDQGTKFIKSSQNRAK